MAIDQETMDSLTRVWSENKLRGRPPRTTLSSLMMTGKRRVRGAGGDGRSHSKLLAELITAGLVLHLPPETCYPRPCESLERKCMMHAGFSDTTLIEATPKVWESAASTPLIIVHIDDEYINPHDARFGVRWNDMALRHKKWCLDHPADYHWILRDQYPPHARQPYTPGQDIPERGGCTPSMELWVSTHDFVAETAHRIFEIRMKNAEARGWGSYVQEVLGLTRAEDYNFFAQARPDVLSFGSGALFGQTPEAFEANRHKAQATLTAMIARGQQGLAALTLLDQKVQERGGWAAVIADYRTWLRKELERNPQAGL